MTSRATDARHGFGRALRGFPCGVTVATGLMLLAVTPIPAARSADCGAMPAASIDWQGCDKGGLLLKSSALDGADLGGADVSFTDLRGSTLAGTNFEKAKMMRSSLAGSTADKANFARVEGYRTIFAKVSAKGASFASAELQRADFADADLTGADFSKAELGRANFAASVLTGAKFPLANLARADIDQAKFEGPLDVTGAFMLFTRIEGMDLTQATGLAQWQLDQACGNAETKLPEGLKAGANWPCKHD